MSTIPAIIRPDMKMDLQYSLTTQVDAPVDEIDVDALLDDDFTGETQEQDASQPACFILIAAIVLQRESY